MHPSRLFDLTGRVALITGGSRGLGLQMARAFGGMGARLALTARKADELELARKELAGAGHEAFVVSSDLSQPQTIAPMVDAVVAHYGTIDILVNNAGASWGAPAAQYPLEAWNKVLGTNVTGAFVVSQQVGVKAMIPRRKGVIINVASIAGFRGQLGPMQTIAYNASKGALINFTKALAAEWAQHGIRVNALAPGFFPSKMSAGILKVVDRQILAMTPMGRLGGDDDLMGPAIFLASDASSYVTGHTLSVDGGMMAV
ncbi:MAG TPA: SDR family oxidoreductase [Usitatibacteraceae bacterium]|nr:SDR family oxidoreductase [Usitatibacteraceae bacterium]